MAVSTIILNWKRTEQVHAICETLAESMLIDEIIVWNNNPEIHFQSDLKKVRTVNCSEDFGLFTRFAAASLAKNECILYHDDDITAPEITLITLYEHWKKQSFSCHTLFGRNPKKGKYSLNTQWGLIEIVLTRYVMVHREVCVHALSKTPKFADLPGIPVGNGEDIILSYAAIDFSGKLNRAYKMATENFGDGDDEFAINKRFPGHLEHRHNIIKRCRQVFVQNLHLYLIRWIYQFMESLKIVFERKKNNNQ
jgi:hypothetical protein